MGERRALLATSFLALFLCAATTARATELSGFAELQVRVFPQSPQFSGQFETLDLSFALEPELFHDFEESGWTFTFRPFVRVDQQDDKRTHFDVRELFVQNRFGDLEISAGARKVFWGVTESVHLVDIINQTDFVENIDGEEKLGQPMVNFSYAGDAGTFDLFLMPAFRERTFPGRDGRLRTRFVVDTDNPIYESSAEEFHFDAAARYSIVLGDMDLGVSHFYGTTREPRAVPVINPGGAVTLLPYYEIVNQTGIDAQYTTGSMLWKLEAITRSGQGDRFWSAAAGFEYTFYGVGGTAVDAGLLGEYLHDTRDALDRFLNPIQDDVFAGTRLTFNDTRDTAILAGVSVDREFGSTFLNIEASRRLTDHWILTAEVRAIFDVDPRDPLSDFKRDSYIQLSLSRYF